MYEESTINSLGDETGEGEEVSASSDDRDIEPTTAQDTDDAERTTDEGDDSASGEVIKVAVDWVEFEGALENNSPDLRSFLNKITGDVMRVFEGGENSDVKLRQTEESDDFVFIEPISSREQYRWMEEFIEVVEEPTLKDKLNIAIDGKGAFRRFKDVLMGYPVERERILAWHPRLARNLCDVVIRSRCYCFCRDRRMLRPGRGDSRQWRCRRGKRRQLL